MVVTKSTGYLLPPSTSLRQEWAANGYTSSSTVGSQGLSYSQNSNGTASKRSRIRERLSSSTKNSQEEPYTSSLIQDGEGNLHDPECEALVKKKVELTAADHD